MDKPNGLDGAATIELLRRIGQGDEKAFAKLFCTINRRVFLFAKHRLGDPRDAEEVLNDTAMELWEHPDRFRGDAKFMTYVLGIANNKATSLLRRRGRVEVDSGDGPEDVADDNPTPFDALCGNETRAVIAQCMEQLSDRQRAIVHLAYFEDLSREEIGSILGCEANAVRQHLWQALRKMKPSLARLN
jgi:RNA polymerase sigma-70 factor, ECF subfamily